MVVNELSPRGLLSLLFHGSKALDVVSTSLDLGLLAMLDRGPITLGELAKRTETKPPRLYKLLDCLESMGLVAREQHGDALEEARYRSIAPLEQAARAVLGPESIERDRDRYGWREIHGRLPDVLRGTHSVSRDAFDWPPVDAGQIASFEASMAAGIPPIAESMTRAMARVLGSSASPSTRATRLLDVGGGDGSLAAALVAAFPTLHVDVLNLPPVEPLVRATIERSRSKRIGFVPGDFLKEPLSSGYDAISFVRVLHDWPAETARMLLEKAYDALLPGGRVIICEELRDPERLAVQFFWTYFLIGVDTCVSRLREVEFYTRALGALGFDELRVIDGPFDVLVATKPDPIG